MGYRLGLVWLLRGVAALSIVAGVLYAIFSLERLVSGANPVLGTAIALVVVALGTLALAESIAIGGAFPSLPATDVLIWVMRAAAVVLFVLFLPTLVGVFQTMLLFGTESEPIVVVQQILLALTTAFTQPALLLGFAEVLYLISRNRS